MSEYQKFSNLVDEYLESWDTYKLQIEYFRSFLIDENMKENVFNLQEIDIDKYFARSMNITIGAQSMLSEYDLDYFLIGKEDRIQKNINSNNIMTDYYSYL